MKKIAQDKLLHFIAGQLIFMITFLVSALFVSSITKVFLIGIGAVIAVALGKEERDKHIKGVFDAGDMLATVAGGIIQMLSFILLLKSF